MLFGMEAQDLLPEGSIVRNRWIVEEKIGKGGFGEVYRCKDDHTNKFVALKLIPKQIMNPGVPCLNNEAKALRAVQGKKFFARYFSYGRTLLFDFLVMELLGKNLKSVRKTQPEKKFSVEATLSMGRMMLKSVEWLHDAGYLHRDIKPSNFAIGIEGNAERVYLIDFGLSKRYVSDSGDLCALRNKVSFRGTSHYASLNVLLGKDAGRRDDLISLFYTLIELSTPKLPWRKVTCRKEMATIKESYDHSSLITDFPATFIQFFNHSNMLATIEKPDYGLLLSTLETCLRQCSIPTSNSSCVGNDGMPGNDSLSDNSIPSQTISAETSNTGDVISASDDEFERSTSCTN